MIFLKNSQWTEIPHLEVHSYASVLLMGRVGRGLLRTEARFVGKAKKNESLSSISSCLQSFHVPFRFLNSTTILIIVTNDRSQDFLEGISTQNFSHHIFFSRILLSILLLTGYFILVQNTGQAFLESK